jgi:hypothetical protein
MHHGQIRSAWSAWLRRGAIDDDPYRIIDDDRWSVIQRRCREHWTEIARERPKIEVTALSIGYRDANFWWKLTIKSWLLSTLKQVKQVMNYLAIVSYSLIIKGKYWILDIALFIVKNQKFVSHSLVNRLAMETWHWKLTIKTSIVKKLKQMKRPDKLSFLLLTSLKFWGLGGKVEL